MRPPGETEQPTGTVTFLFTDIEGSTALLQELGPEFGDVLDAHRRLLREAFARHDGYEVDTQGDSFFVAFARPEDAAAGAVEAQHALERHAWPQGKALHVRMGLHTSSADASDGRYVGLGVHRGARIGAAAHGGQVLVSQTTRELLDGGGSGFSFSDLGLHRLKDLGEPERLHQLVIDGLLSEFPPLRTLDNRPTNLPAQATPFLGREREVEELRELVGSTRYTRRHADGTGWNRKNASRAPGRGRVGRGVPRRRLLRAAGSGLRSNARCPRRGGGSGGINEAGGQSLLGYLGEKRILFVLDNLEQVLNAAGDLADLLRNAPGVTLLVTSREPVRLAAERVVPVDTLALPASDRTPDVDTLMRSPGRRAVRVEGSSGEPGLRADDGQRPRDSRDLRPSRRAAACPRARSGAHCPAVARGAVLSRLDERLELLTGGARDLPARQQTLRDTIAWSYDLLDEREQDVFTRLSVLVGGFTLDSAEAVCGATVDDLTSLAAKSLIRREGQRLTMLETIREFASERLEPDAADVRERHAQFFLELAESAYAERIEREAEWADRLAAEHDNLRAALDWLEGQAGRDALRLAGALGWFWRARSHMKEGREEASDGVRNGRRTRRGARPRADERRVARRLAGRYGSGTAAARGCDRAVERARRRARGGADVRRACLERVLRRRRGDRARRGGSLARDPAPRRRSASS